ncbi:acetyltransferase [Galdieria sulphuraria]|uniref:Acetyltransferase n=1 Tax=Galdieria sulphuraria TaxID=130081 RepID=M2XBS9_GALSU|nr:acetyltransferase [Galdieria sulphuraria]EME27332.1 acetyltransferase [Galdieria sulphuraria]|eukprot:XP_005703852.1 acetyltransferase [Galdieria sulphuraria]
MRLLSYMEHGHLWVDSFSTHYSLFLLTGDESLEDLCALVDLINICYRSPSCWTNESSLIQGERVNLEQVREYIKSSEILVLKRDGTGSNGSCNTVSDATSAAPTLLGCIRTGPVSETVVGPLAEPAGYVGLLCSHPFCQGKGIGSFLIKAAEERCANFHGLNKMVMDVLDAREELIQWYGKKGYHRTKNFVPARSFIEGKGELMLKDCNFILLEKKLDMK